MADPTSLPVPSNQPADLEFNAKSLDRVLNSPALTFQDRLGVARDTWAGVQAKFNADFIVSQTGQNAAASATGAGVATAQAGIATAAAASASNALYDYYADDAADLATKIAAASEGQRVFRRDNQRIYKKVSGAAVDQGLAPTATKAEQADLQRLAAKYPAKWFTGYKYTWTCPYPSDPTKEIVAGGIWTDGTLAWGTGYFYNLTVATEIDATTKAYPKRALPGYVHNVFDLSGRVAGGVKESGTLHYADAQFVTLNGVPVEDFTSVRSTRRLFQSDVLFVANHGQSLAQGPFSPVTTAQAYDTVAFPAHSTAPTSWAPATAATASDGGNKEIPAFGATDCVKALIASEDGITYAQQSFQLLIGNAAYGGYSISQLNKGTGPYAELMGQVAAGYSIAQAAGKLFSAGAMLWVQGEANYLDTQSAYLAALRKLAQDYDADCRAITGQLQQVFTIASQTTSQGQTAYSRAVQLAMVQAQYDDPLIVLAGPQYMYPYLNDGYKAHVNAAATRLLGAVMGLALKRTIIEGRKWRPLLPVSATRQGKLIYLRFNKSGLVFDTTTVPAQAGYGISVTSEGGAELAVSSVALAQPDTVRIECASAVPANHSVWLGGKVATGIANYSGGATNIRDRQGDTLTFDGQPLHNWACIDKIGVL